MYNFQKLSEARQHLSVAIIPLNIVFLKGTDRCFSRRYEKLCVNVAYKEDLRTKYMTAPLQLLAKFQIHVK